MIFWADKSSDDVHVVVEHYPSPVYPAKKLTTVSVPGRNGDLIFDEGAYENYSQPYDVYISAERPRLPRIARLVAQWLYSPTGYQRLEDSYEPDIYRLAYYAGPTDIENILNRFGRASISFACKPQRFLRYGEDPVKVQSGSTLHNPTAFPALPFVTVSGTAGGTLQIGGVTVKILSLNGTLTLDSDTQNAYSGTQNKNSTISAPEFPSLKAGENTIYYDGGITAVEIIPRWWTL